MSLPSHRRPSVTVPRKQPLPPAALVAVVSAFCLGAVVGTFSFPHLPNNWATAPSSSRFRVSPRSSSDTARPQDATRARLAWISRESITPALTVLNGACPDQQRTAIQERDSNDKPFHRGILATIPRSGNHLIRYLLESTTRVQTETMQQEKKTNEWKWRSLAFGGCPLDDRYDCNGSEIRRSEGQDSVVVKHHFPFHGPSPIWGESQNHIDSIVTTIRDPFENYLSWLFYKCRNQPEREIYLFQHYLVEWVDFHLFYRDFARHTCTKLFEVRYEELSDEFVRARTVAELSERLGFEGVRQSDVASAAKLYNMTLNPPAERLGLAPDVACLAFRSQEVEDEPSTWDVFRESEGGGPLVSELISDYKLADSQSAFRQDFNAICRQSMQSVTGREPGHHVSCPDLNRALNNQGAARLSNPLS